MSKLHIIALLSSLLSVPAAGVIISTRVLQKQNSDQTVVLWGDHHDNHSANKEQWRACKCQLRSYPQTHKGPLSFLVENPLPIFRLFNPGATGIFNRIVPHHQSKRKNYSENIKVCDIENRHIAQGACFIFDPRKNPCEISPKLTYPTTDYKDSICVEDITFQHLTDEYKTRKNEIKNDFHALSESEWNAIVAEPMKESKKERRYLKNVMDKCAIKPDCPMLAKAQQIANPKSRENIGNCIMSMFCPLFELRAYHKIKSSPEQHTVVVTGNDHAQTICSMLVKSNYRFKGGTKYKPVLTPLTEKELDVTGKTVENWEYCCTVV